MRFPEVSTAIEQRCMAGSYKPFGEWFGAAESLRAGGLFRLFRNNNADVAGISSQRPTYLGGGAEDKRTDLRSTFRVQTRGGSRDAERTHEALTCTHDRRGD